MSLVSQPSRMGRLATVLGKDALVLQRFAGREAMSALFNWQVDCLPTASGIDFDALIGTHATVSLENPGQLSVEISSPPTNSLNSPAAGICVGCGRHPICRIGRGRRARRCMTCSQPVEMEVITRLSGS